MSPPRRASPDLTRALATDFAADGIRVNALAPGYVATAMTATSFNDPAMHEERRRHTMLGRWGNPDDMVGAAIFLASPASAYMTGQEIFVDGGWTTKGLAVSTGDKTVKAPDPRIAERIGFMQGRLSALVDGKIQAFPWNEWREEFPRAKALGLGRMEWTIDQERLRENPLTTESGRGAISRLSRGNAVRNSEPDRRLLHAGAVLESGRPDAGGAARRPRSGARLLRRAAGSNSS